MPTPSNDLNISQAGYVVFDGTATFTGRTFQAGTGITLSNASGVSGNTTISSTASLTDLHVAKWIVNSTSNAGGNATTIQQAINQAISGETIFIMPGTYTENLTLKAGVNLAAFNGDQSTPNVTIVGNSTLSSAGTVSISNIRMQTNSAALLTVSGSAASIVNLNNCYLNCTNNTGISFTTSSSSARINVNLCEGNLGTTGIKIFDSSSAGMITFKYSNLTNSGASTTASTISAGNFEVISSTLKSPITSSGTASIAGEFSLFDTSSQNATALTIGGSTLGSIQSCIVSSGSASSISISTSQNVFHNQLISTNTNVITGAGTLIFSGLTFAGSSSGINTTTLSPLVVKGGFYQGNLTSTSPASGMIGQQLSASAASVSILDNTATNITSVSLTAGIWDVSVIAYYAPTTFEAKVFQTGISATSATFEGTVGQQLATTSCTASDFTHTVPLFRVALSATTTYYLVGLCNFITGTCTANGRISATRVA